MLLVLAAVGATRPAPVIHHLRLRERILSEGDDVLLSWNVSHAAVITVLEADGSRHAISLISGWRGRWHWTSPGRRSGISPLPVRSSGWLRAEICNGRHRVRVPLGQVHLVAMPRIDYVTIGDPDLNSMSDFDVEGLIDGLARVADVLPNWRTAVQPVGLVGPDIERPQHEG